MLRTSESIKNIAKALLEAQKLMGSAKKDSKNPFFKSTYADLGSIMEVCKEALNVNGITVLQPSTTINGKNCITTRLQHDSGEFYEADSEVVVSKQNDPQAKGAGETYTRRFSLQAFLFIPSEDDDGNQAAGRDTKPVYTKPTPTPTKAATASGPTNTALVSGLTNVNAEFDAIKKPEATTLAPLKTSSFRKPAKVAPAKAVEAPTTEATSDWN